MSIFATIGYGVLSSYCMRLSIILALASLTLISGSSGLDGPFYWISESLSLVFLSLKKRRQGKLSQLTGSPREKGSIDVAPKEFNLEVKLRQTSVLVLSVTTCVCQKLESHFFQRTSSATPDFHSSRNPTRCDDLCPSHGRPRSARSASQYSHDVYTLLSLLLSLEHLFGRNKAVFLPLLDYATGIY